ncbi:acetylornithine deacetylase [soil metagenome]
MPAPADLDTNAASIELLSKLVAFDTTSRLSNLALISFVEDYLARLGVRSTRVMSEDGTKANLYATLGPACEGGVVLSGHSDVVPVDGQDWSSDPFRLVRRDDRLYGRGTTDMKGFIACALAAAPMFAAPGRLQRPVHIALSYDEELGCFGAPAMIDHMARSIPRPSVVIVGEPTEMTVVGSHKGGAFYEVQVQGQAAHSSLPQFGLSANAMAVRLMQCLLDIAHDQEINADPASLFAPAFSTISIGKINGGTANNILAQECNFTFDIRLLPSHDRQAILQPFFAEMVTADAAARQRFPHAGITCKLCASVPALAFETQAPAAAMARLLADGDGQQRVVAYATEGGQFQEAGFSTVVCGPGSMQQGHQPDEFIAVDQMRRCTTFMSRLAEHLS